MATLALFIWHVYITSINITTYTFLMRHQQKKDLLSQVSVGKITSEEYKRRLREVEGKRQPLQIKKSAIIKQTEKDLEVVGTPRSMATLDYANLPKENNQSTIRKVEMVSPNNSMLG